jgi:hypothetical protein
MPDISIEDNAPPIVRIMRRAMQQAADQPALAKRMDSMRGRVALRSTTDPQAATIHFDRGAVRITHGVDDEVDVVISTDLNTLGQPGAPKPKVKGALRNLRLALGVAKVLDAPVPGGWKGAAERFWTWAEGRAGRPEHLLVVCTDDSAMLGLGDGGPSGSTLELQGPSWALAALFTGGDHLGAALIEGRVQVVGTFPTLSELIGLLATFMLEDG